MQNFALLEDKSNQRKIIFDHYGLNCVPEEKKITSKKIGISIPKILLCLQIFFYFRVFYLRVF